MEKPDAPKAQAMLQDGKHLWNAGNFLFTAATILTAFQQHAPDQLAMARAAVEGAECDLGFTRLTAGPWEKLQDISIGYAVVE